MQSPPRIPPLKGVGATPPLVVRPPAALTSPRQRDDTPVFYRSAVDGWRVGAVRGFAPHAGTVAVTDDTTGLPEPCRSADVVLPPDSDAAAWGPLLAAGRTQHYVPERGAAQQSKAAAAAAAFLPCDMAGDLSPSPLVSVPASIDCLRERASASHAAARSAGSPPDSTVSTTFVGDNVVFALRSGPPSGILDTAALTTTVARAVADGPGSRAPVRSFFDTPTEAAPPAAAPLHCGSDSVAPCALAQRIATALKATRRPQVGVFAGAMSGSHEWAGTTAALSAAVGAPDAAVGRIAAAATVLQAFTHDVRGQLHAATQMRVLATGGGIGSGAAPAPGDVVEPVAYTACDVGVSMLDDHRLGCTDDAAVTAAPFEVLGFVAFAFSAEECDRCYVAPPTRRNRPPFQAVDPRLGLDAALLDRLRQRYFLFAEAMETLGFEVQVQLFLMSRVAAVMHLLDATFADPDPAADGRGDDAELPAATNLNALRNAAKLLSADFQHLQQVLCTRARCVMAARLLYTSTVEFLLSKLSAALNPTGSRAGNDGVEVAATLCAFAAVDVDGAARPGDGPRSPYELYTNTLYEDALQGLIRGADGEVTAWQQEGFVPPRGLQAALDLDDNYDTLRLLRGRGGVLSLVEALAGIHGLHHAASDEQRQAARAAARQHEHEQSRHEQQQAQAPPQDAAEADDGSSPYAQLAADVAAMVGDATSGSAKHTRAPLDPAECPAAAPPQFHSMELVFAAACALAAPLDGTKLDRPLAALHDGATPAAPPLMLTVGPSGNATVWRLGDGKDQGRAVFTFSLSADVFGANAASRGRVQLQVKTGKKSTGLLELSLLPDPGIVGVDAARRTNSSMNALLRVVKRFLPATASVTVARDESRDDDDAPASETDEAPPARNNTPPPATPAGAIALKAQAIAAAAPVLAALRNRRDCSVDPAGCTVTVAHSFGSRTYALPPVCADIAAGDSGGDGAAPPLGSAAAEEMALLQWATPWSAAFDAVREFLLACTDVETQEALYLAEQARALAADDAAAAAVNAAIPATLRRGADAVAESIAGALAGTEGGATTSAAWFCVSLPLVPIAPAERLVQVVGPAGGSDSAAAPYAASSVQLAAAQAALSKGCCGFNGAVCEGQLQAWFFPQLRRLRAALPRRYLTVPYSNVLAQYTSLLPPSRARLMRAAATAAAAATTSDDDAVVRRFGGLDKARLFGEEVCIEAGVPHVVGAHHLLLEAASLLRLDLALARHHAASAARVQAALRGISAALAVRRRLTSIADVVARDDAALEQLEASVAWQRNHDAASRQQRFRTAEAEAAARKAVSDAAWVAWVALQAAARSDETKVRSKMAADAVERRQREAQLLARRTDREAAEELAASVRRQILRQGATLDAVVREGVEKDAAARRRMDRQARAHERNMAVAAAREEERAIMQAKLRNKAGRADAAKQMTEARRQAVREAQWAREERDRVVRKQIEDSRAAIAAKQSQDIAMKGIEVTLKAQVRQEMSVRQRAQRDAQTLAMREEKQRREAALVEARKRQHRREAQAEVAMQREAEAAQAADRRAKAAQWRVQEDERLEQERRQRDDERRQKVMTRRLLQAHAMLAKPAVFQHDTAASAVGMAPKGTVRGGADAGFVMSGGQRSVPALLPPQAWDQVLQHHATPRSGGPRAGAAGSPGGAAAGYADPEALLMSDDSPLRSWSPPRKPGRRAASNHSVMSL